MVIWAPMFKRTQRIKGATKMKDWLVSVKGRALASTGVFRQITKLFLHLESFH